MLKRNWRKLEALAEELLRAKTLSYRECVEVFNCPATNYQKRQNRA
jgi:hypothetical protein